VVWALGRDRFRVVSPTDEHEVVGHDAAVQLADEPAQRAT
jgi:hypothetical protein